MFSLEQSLLFTVDVSLFRSVEEFFLSREKELRGRDRKKFGRERNGERERGSFVDLDS